MKNISVTIKKENTVTLIIILFFFSFFLDQIVPYNLSTLTFTIGMSAYFFIINKINLKIFLWIFILVSFMLVSTIFTMNNTILSIIKSVQYFGIAILLINYKVNIKLLRISYYIHAAFFILHIALGTNPNMIFSSSRNIISVIMLIQASLIYLESNQQSVNFTYLPALLSFLISIWAMGRSGILSSGLLLIGVLIATLTLENRKRNVIVTIMILIGIFFMFIQDINVKIISNFVTNYNLFFRNFERIGLESNARDYIRIEYISQITSSIKYFVFGLPIETNSIFSSFNYNLHNSYLRLHANYGIGGFLLIIIPIVSLIISSFSQKEMLLVFITLAFLTRVFTDTIGFYGIVDPIIYFLIFTQLFKHKYNILR